MHRARRGSMYFGRRVGLVIVIYLNLIIPLLQKRRLIKVDGFHFIWSFKVALIQDV